MKETLEIDQARRLLRSPRRLGPMQRRWIADLLTRLDDRLRAADEIRDRVKWWLGIEHDD